MASDPHALPQKQFVRKQARLGRHTHVQHVASRALRLGTRLLLLPRADGVIEKQ